MRQLREIDLYRPVKVFLDRHGYSKNLQNASATPIQEEQRAGTLLPLIARMIRLSTRLSLTTT
jgi:hypothetical protein